MGQKYVCLKPGCRFVTESEYESEQHQKIGEKHDIFILKTDYMGKVTNTDIDTDYDGSVNK